jgi:hypothetical protein
MTSVFAQDTSLEVVGVTLVSEIGAGRGKDLADGWRELRQTFGYSLLAPFVLLALLVGMGPKDLMAQVGLTDPNHQSYAMIGFWVLFAYTLFELNIRQRLIYGHGQNSGWGVDLRRQDRDHSELVGIELPKDRRSRVLSFGDGSRLYASKHLSGRAWFINEMQSIITTNLGRDLRRQEPGLAACLGF